MNLGDRVQSLAPQCIGVLSFYFDDRGCGIDDSAAGR